VESELKLGFSNFKSFLPSKEMEFGKKKLLYQELFLMFYLAN